MKKIIVVKTFRWSDENNLIRIFEADPEMQSMPDRAAEIALEEGWGVPAEAAAAPRQSRRHRVKALVGAPENKSELPQIDVPAAGSLPIEIDG
ncbi:MAG: hypothetical protein DCC73_14980 [Proteobacteria bacterium]|nr:MAG: hypothetical protein DCC73_14980 [Pseudomonadota bacterium]